MKTLTFPHMRHKGTVARRLMSWSAVYVLLVAGSVALAAQLYAEIAEHRLPLGYLELSLDKPTYVSGEVVAFTVTNHFPTPIYVTNHCPHEPLSVYRWSGTAWEERHAIAEEAAECRGQERSVAIAPEASRSYDFADWPHLFSEPGTYRIAMMVDHADEVPYQDFVVTASPKIVPAAVVPQVETPPQDAAQAVPTPRQDQVDVRVVPEPVLRDILEDEEEEEEEDEERDRREEYEEDEEHDRDRRERDHEREDDND